MLGSVRKQPPIPPDMPIFRWDSVDHQRKIGEGSYAEVSLYYSNQHGQVAIKQLRNEFSTHQKSFMKEAKLMNKLNHPNIIKFWGYCSNDDAMMLEYAAFDFSVLSTDYNFHKYSLDQLLAKIDQDWDFVQCEHLNDHITSGLIDGLTYLHKSHIAHRDLKPSNIIVSNMHYANANKEIRLAEWRRSPVLVKLSDFGESRSNMVQTRSIIQTRTDDLYRGSPAYMAPEILCTWHGKGPTPQATIKDLLVMDVWSLAMVLFVMLNPDSTYPYEREIKKMLLPSVQGAAEKALVNFWKQEKLPEHGTKYEHNRDSHWKCVRDLYDRCAKINAVQRPEMKDLQDSFQIIHNISTDFSSSQHESSQDTHTGCEEPSATSMDWVGAVDGPEGVSSTANMNFTTDRSPVDISLEEDPQDHIRADMFSSHCPASSCQTNFSSKGETEDLPDFISPDLTILSLRNSQMTAITEYDCLLSELASSYGMNANLSFKLPENDATNGCTFLCLMIGAKFRPDKMDIMNITELKESAEEVIDMFPPELNIIRSKERGYEPVEAMELLISLEIIDEACHLSPSIGGRKFDAASSNELNHLWKDCSGKKFRTFIVVSPPYTILMMCNDAQVILLDTHPVPPTLGGIKNGVIVRGSNSESGRKPLNEWLQRRFYSKLSTYAVSELHMYDSTLEAGCESSHNPTDILSDKTSGKQEEDESENESDMEIVDSDEDLQEYATGKGRIRSLLHKSNWDDFAEQSSIPYDVDGQCKFRLPCDKDSMMRVSKDGRPWGTWVTSSRKGFNGIRRTAACKGSPACINPECSLNGQQNRGQFEKHRLTLICKLCKQEVVTPKCLARKVWEYSQGEVVVMHTGKHTCVAQKVKTSTKELRKELRSSPYTSASSFVQGKMASLMASENINWQAVEDVAEEFVDVKRINNAKLKLSSDGHGSSFDALCHFKKETDRQDKFLVYKLNNKEMNNGLPTFVFKSSKSMADIAISMDKDKRGQRRSCYAFLDAKHGRTLGMKTLTLWTYDAALQMTLLLACMDAEEESTESIILFWNLWNEILQDVTGDRAYHFNPIGWVADENPANRKAIGEVFGEEAVSRTYSCEFHFRQSCKKHAPKANDPDEFRRLSDRLLKVHTEEEYTRYYEKLRKLCRSCNLESWLDWWHEKRSHIFRAFKPFDAPNTNLAEIGHAWLARTSGCRVVLIRACRNDVINAIRQEKKISMLWSGESKLGRGPSQQAVAEKSRKRQMKFVSEASKEMAAASGGKEERPGSRSKSTKTKRTSSALVSAKYRHDLPPLSRKQEEERKKQPLVVVRRTGMMRKCHGCGCDLEAQKMAPNDLILKREDFREYKHRVTGMWYRQAFLTNTYYDLDMQCVRLKHPSASLSSVVVPEDLHLHKEHIKILHEFGVHLRCDNCII